MSHGGGGDGAIAEPNLTPLLDVVLQLLMFFMMCVNFVTEQVNEDITLPKSQTAKPMDKSDPDVLFLNLKPYRSQDYAGRYKEEEIQAFNEKFKDDPFCAMALGKPPMRMSELQYFLKQQYEDASKALKDGKKVDTLVVIRAHKDADYAEIFKVLQICKTVGYKKLNLRSIISGGGSK
jgi:biopolymer transport protein ExbD